MMHEHAFHCPEELMHRTVRVLVVGAGGTGGEVMDRLVRLHYGICRTGHPGGLAVTLCDGDTVSDANIGRQRFTPFDIDESKADLLIHRLNLAYDLHWRSVPEFIQTENSSSLFGNADLIITCVDNAATRAGFAKALRPFNNGKLWLDFGNGNNRGQYVLGHASLYDQCRPLLPHVVTLFPSLKRLREDDTPSCSFAEAILHQDLLVNAVLADQGINLLWQLFRRGRITHHGGFVDVSTGTCQPLPIDDAAWLFLNPRLPKRFREQFATESAA